jgi:protein TonB
MDLSRRRLVRALLAGFVVVAGLGGIVLAQAQQPPDDFVKGAFLKTEPGLTAPKPTYQVEPKYTPEAMRAKVQGVVKLQVVVATDGTVSRVRVLQSLDTATGLDDAAVAAAKQWKFTPGTLKDKPVNCAIELDLQFKLH